MRFQKFGHKILHNLRLWHFSAKNVLLFGLKVLVAHVFVGLEVLIAHVFVRLEVLIAHVLVGLDRARQEYVLLKPRA